MLYWALPSLIVACWIPLLRGVRHNADSVRGCQIPEKWTGSWFQSGVRQSIIIRDNRISSKGRCLASDGDKFLVIDEKMACYRCVAIHEKHENVLQYKETFCVHRKETLNALCALITGDALLYSMFREDGVPVPCPFRGGHTFTYNRGHGECSYPLSTIDSCTHDSRLLLRYQACPDVYATESAVEELQCLATWKEGSMRYLVGKIHHNHATSNEERYRCFVYEKVPVFDVYDDRFGKTRRSDDVEYKVAQSGDATCNGIFSPNEGSRTMTLKKAPNVPKCKFPSWLTQYSHWHALDYQRVYVFHHQNTTLHIANSTAPTPSDTSGGGNINPQQLSALNSEQDIRVVCTELKSDDNDVAHVIAHYTMGCQNGFVCMMFYKRDDHVIEIQTGLPTRRQEDACSKDYFDRSSIPFITLVTTNLEKRTCPKFGKYSVSGVTKTRQKRHPTEYAELPIYMNLEYQIKYNRTRDRRELHSFTMEGVDGCSKNVNKLVVGCSAPDTMEFKSSCDNNSKQSPVTSVYTCHGGWNDNNTNFLITTPQSRSSRGARRYCFIYEVSNGAMIRFSTSSDSCNRDFMSTSASTLAFNLTSLGKCGETSHTNKISPNGIVILFVVTILISLSFDLFETLQSHKLPVR